MVNRPLDFRHRDVVRGIRAARASGIDSQSLRIRTPAGTEYYFGGGEVARPNPKKSVERDTDLAEGGSTKMAGRGDRTVTAAENSAAPQRAGTTGHKTSGNPKTLKGGERKPKLPGGGLSLPAKPA